MDENTKQILQDLVKEIKHSNTKSFLIGILCSVIIVLSLIFSFVILKMHTDDVKAFTNQTVTVETSANANTTSSGSNANAKSNGGLK